MSPFDRLLPDREKEELVKAAQERYACRVFDSPVSPSEYAALSYVAGRFEAGSVRLRLCRVPERFFGGSLMGLGRVQGCSCLCLVCISDEKDTTLAGFCGEALVLHAVRLGLTTCWLTGGYSRKMAEEICPEGFKILAVIALGHAPAPSGLSRKRKELKKLCLSDPAQWPHVFLQAAMLVQAAPSSGNSQPFLMDCRENTFMLDSSDRTRLELGIGICHASLAFRGPISWVFSEKKNEPMAACILQIANLKTTPYNG